MCAEAHDEFCPQRAVKEVVKPRKIKLNKTNTKITMLVINVQTERQTHRQTNLQQQISERYT